MNEDQKAAFRLFHADLVEKCKQTFPEAVEAVELEGPVAQFVMEDYPVGEQRGPWVDTLNATFDLMQVADLEDSIWAKVIIFRWIWDWEEAHPVTPTSTPG